MPPAVESQKDFSRIFIILKASQTTEILMLILIYLCFKMFFQFSFFVYNNKNGVKLNTSWNSYINC